MLGRGGILLCPRGFPAVTVRLKLRDGAAKSPCTCGLVSEIYMGWAKYYEDNLSIMNNRLPFTYAEKEEPLYQVRPSIHEAVKVAPSRKRDRAELKIHFTGGDNRIAARKLQINGWWWSKLNNCWCNYNTAINRAFAEQIQRKMDTTNAAA